MKSLIFRSFLGALAFSLGACKPAPPAPKPEGPLTLAVPAKGAYTGAYIDFGDTEDEVTLEGIERFEKLVGKHQAVIASSSYWGEQSFPTANLNIIRRHGSVPLLFWSPWDRPYDQCEEPDAFALPTILEGKWDAYIDRWGDAARDYGFPLLVSFGNEMNGQWFPWSGVLYGAGNPVKGKEGCYQGPETFKAAYRHVVDRVRARGAHNILWVFHPGIVSFPDEPWNNLANYYPGADYADWLAYSIYGAQFETDPWNSFTGLLDGPYKKLCALDPNKPLMLAEWGVGEFPNKGSKADFIRGAFGSIADRYPRIKASVFWHERWQNDEGNYSNLRANSSPEALAAFRRGIAAPFWLDKPELIPAIPTKK